MYRKLKYISIIAVFLFGCSSDDSQLKPIDEQENPEIIPSISNVSIEIVSPVRNQDFSYHNDGFEGIFEDPRDSKLFEGKIQITYGANSEVLTREEINVSWESNIDGILFEGPPSEDLTSEFSTSLSKGIHTIYFEVTIDTIQVTDSLQLSNLLTLTASETGSSVEVKWSKFNGNNFQSYSIFRESSSPIAIIDDVNTLTYFDKDIESLIDEYQYQVIVNTSEESPYPLGSNLDSAHAGIFLKFPYYVYKTIKDPERNKTYSIVRPQSSSVDSDQYGVLIIDLNADSIRIDSHILTADRFADLDISPDGKYLFLCQERVEKITRLDLETYDIFSFETDTNGWGIHKVEVGEDNTLYCHRDPPTSGSTGFWIYNGNTGEFLTTSYYAGRHGDMELSNNLNTLIHGESNSTGAQVLKFYVDTDTMILDEDHNSRPSASLPEPFILVSEKNDHIFWEEFQYNLEFELIRTFDTKIKACSPNHLYLSDYSKIYRFNDMSIVCELPESPPSENTSFIFMNDETAFFQRAYNTNTNNEEYTYFFRIKL